MTDLKSRLDTCSTERVPSPVLCDSWTNDGVRAEDLAAGDRLVTTLGVWPDPLELDAIVQLEGGLVADDDDDVPVDERSWWELFSSRAPVTEGLTSRAALQPLDTTILAHLQHLQHVCYRPRLHLRVEEERLPVSRARRWPVRAVADLVSHPGDWEHRSIKSIQPARVLARRIEDDWNLYENRVAVRLVDNLLAYVAQRLEELRKIEKTLESGSDHGDQTRSHHLRARRIMSLWAKSLNDDEEELDELIQASIRRLTRAERDLQKLIDAPLYRHVPRRATVQLALKPTNILINDTHYRKVATLWRAWVKLGRKRQETRAQRRMRQHREARAWDRFVLHIVVRALHNLGWHAEGSRPRWTLRREGWRNVEFEYNELGGVLSLRAGDSQLHLLPLCADLGTVEPSGVMTVLERWDYRDGQVVGVHVGRSTPLACVDRSTGWSFGRKSSMLACSPWSIDSEERMTRVISGWLNRAAIHEYPSRRRIPALPTLPREWSWLRRRKDLVIATRPPHEHEVERAYAWIREYAQKFEQERTRARKARGNFDSAPLAAVQSFSSFIGVAKQELSKLDVCPACAATSCKIENRPGAQSDGSEDLWWAWCRSCGSEWGLRVCSSRSCGARFRVFRIAESDELERIRRECEPPEWPDRVLGSDTWAQPCGRSIVENAYRCAACGDCPGGGCSRCAAG